MINEIIQNYKNFETEQKKLLNESLSNLEVYSNKFLESYIRLVPFQAWKEYIISVKFTEGALSFFIEAQNDALISYLLARQGMWRPSLQSLRSCIENILAALYYADHPVEYKLWSIGKHKLGFTGAISYFEQHPDFLKNKEITGIVDLQHEYAELSKAVHGSSESFRMVSDGHVPSVWIPDTIKLSQWCTRQKKTLEALNLMLIIYNQEMLKGTSHTYLRKSLSSVIKKGDKNKIKKLLGIYII